MAEPGLPRVKILATGGTIAGEAGSDTQLTGYTAGTMGIEQLMDAVPQMAEYARIDGEQTANIDSSAMTHQLWLKLAKRVNQLFAADGADGIVITHGTDTLEETAYFLNLVVKYDRPVVLTGAMRPATALSADGALNLLDAVRLAASAGARGKGVLVCLNGQINSAREVTKTHTTQVETFQAPELGCLGLMQNGKPYFYRHPARKHTVKSEFETPTLRQLPRVDIVYSHAHADGVMVEAAVAAGAKGIVHAGLGHGNIFPLTKKALLAAAKKGVAVVKASRVGGGMVTRTAADAESNFIAADTLNPQKARVLLLLALTKTNDLREIQRMFDEY